MGHYVSLIRYTQQGARENQGEPGPARRGQKSAPRRRAGRSHAWYLTMGKYDAVIISEFPNDETSREIRASRGSSRLHHHPNPESLYRSRIP